LNTTQTKANSKSTRKIARPKPENLAGQIVAVAKSKGYRIEVGTERLIVDILMHRITIASLIEDAKAIDMKSETHAALLQKLTNSKPIIRMGSIRFVKKKINKFFVKVADEILQAEEATRLESSDKSGRMPDKTVSLTATKSLVAFYATALMGSYPT
jgi:hypothetical protein